MSPDESRFSRLIIDVYGEDACLTFSPLSACLSVSSQGDADWSSWCWEAHSGEPGPLQEPSHVLVRGPELLLWFYLSSRPEG